MKLLIAILSLTAACAFAQSGEPELAKTKLAAEAGDPVAQYKFAHHFASRMDSAQVEIWCRKSAEQGYVPAQGWLGSLLLMRSRNSAAKSATRTTLEYESLKWVTLAAFQGDLGGQTLLADFCLDGKLVKQDFIEAYKWGDLASKTLIDSGRTIRDNAILKMDAGQIAEARRRVAAFKPHVPEKSEWPEPAWVAQLKLNSITEAGKMHFAVIRNHSFEKGERATIKIDWQSVVLQCLEITTNTATISIEGIEGHRTLHLN